MAEQLTLAVCLISFLVGFSKSQTCDFDTGICNYVQSKNDTFDWTRYRGAVTTSGTGPRKDHTSEMPGFIPYTKNGNGKNARCVFPFIYNGKKYTSCTYSSHFRKWCATTANYDKDKLWGECVYSGFYMYIETSSPRVAGDRALLTSPTIKAGTKCLTFWYHMYGPNVDTLNIYTNTSSGLSTAIWSKTGSQGNAWKGQNITLQQSNDFQIVFEGIRGTSYKGDIAIDDVVVKDGSCSPGTSKQCTFEKDKCDFQDVKGMDFTWTRSRGSTPSGQTGPTADHTLGTSKGYYMYIEASSKKVGSKAGLRGKMTGLPPKGSCLIFWYHMFGLGTGSLRVLLNDKLFWSISGQQGNRWIKEKVPISGTSANVTFVGVVGKNYQGDIAIDDISLVDGLCVTPGNCNFENGLCTWYNARSGDNFDWIIGSGGTPSSFTGPTADHNGDKKAKYLFIESSSPRQTGHKARLLSTVFNQTSTGVGNCFTFWYHMFGTGIGSLRIYVKSAKEQLVWRLSGDKGNKWYNGQVNVGYKIGSFQVIVEAKRGTDYTGDIAIDDFVFKPGRCLVLPTSADPNVIATTSPPTKKPTPTPTIGNNGYDCNFEQVGCSWKNVAKTDQLNWTRQQGSTPSVGTGPTTDHTLKTKYGWYIYLEVSSTKVNSSARFLSPVIPATTALGGRCLRFWYHMYGPHVNTLNVYTKATVQSALGKPVWSRYGTQGNKWNEAAVTVTSSTPFQVVLEGKTGYGYMGDIAIDDISVRNGLCPTPSTTCTFETPDICSYTHEDSAATDFKWTRASKNTASIGTGPNTDHTTQSASGFYMYTEASGRKRGDKARLLSPVEPKGQYCMTFWYHMYGADIGSLNVFAKTGNTLPSRPIWSENGNKGNVWKRADLNVKTTTSFQVVFEGTVGSGFQGDIAIDDVALKKGTCPPPGFCTFENGMCTYVNDKIGDDFDWIVGSAGTPSFYTGPATDHTTRSKNGKYIFIEASQPVSGKKRVAGHKARLVSEQFNTLGAKSRCFSFWYHMYGADIGSLQIIYKTSTGSKPETMIWNLTGQQQTSGTDPWRYATAPMRMDSDHMIILQGVQGSGYRGDIAVDDIQVLNQACTVLPPEADPNGPPSPKPTTPYPRTGPTTIPSGPLNCQFETGFCSYTQDSSDRFNWTRVQGYTHSRGTGPSVDHTVGKGSVGPLGPGSLTHSGGKCIHVLNGAWNKPTDDQPIVLYEGCGQSRLEFKLENGFLKLTKYNMCVRPKGSSTAENTEVGVSDKCGNDKWQILSTGVIQHVPSKKCLIPKNRYSNPPNNNKLVISSTCNYFSQKFSWVPTLGFYAFIETSSPRKPNDTARLISPQVTTPKQCLKFWYHMFGAHVNQLNVYLKNATGLGRPVWSKFGTHGDLWRSAQVYMTAKTPYQIVFEAIRGNGYMGDVAIDDVEVVSSCGAPLECTFEETSPPLCGWMNVRGFDNYDWTRANGRTASFFTGPSNDHTYGNSKGYYMYIEASNMKTGWKAQLWSTKYPSAAKSNGKCLQFWYHMYGFSIGTLNLYVKAGSNPVGASQWTRSGNQGNQWNIGQIEISVGSSFQVIVEAVRGRSFTGDIAIDDIKMLDGVCNKPADCDFENDRCTWSNARKEDDFDWIVAAGASPSQATGPIADHTKRNGEGKYLLLETSAPRKMGEKARYLSEKFQGVKLTYCLRFWYHMYGYAIGTLNVLIKTGPGKFSEKVVWSLSGNQGRMRWRMASVPILSSSNFQMVFEGIAGNGSTGDIAVDDITYTRTVCSLQPSTAKPLPPTTQPPRTPKPTTPAPDSYKCDFEKDLCTWTQDVSDNFNWTRHKGKTSSTDTGPSADHTLKNGNGTYLFIETSSPRKLGDKARLLSQIVPADSKTGGHCVKFWFHMYGPDIHSLNVYTKQGQQLIGPVWKRVGNNGNKWIYGQAEVKSLVDYQVVFEGVRGSSFNGDISLDDIDVVAGACPVSKQCDFEHGFCNYNNDKNDNFDWTRRKGATPSFFTGPSTDHTLQTSQGYYVYTEVSGTLKKGTKARLVSTEYTQNTPMCLEFWYHLYGAHIGTLNVYVQITAGGQTVYNRIWTRSGNHGKSWKVARATVSGGQGRKLVFEGVRGTGFMGDIALDDIKLMDGNCPPPGNCNFETGGMCTWTNAKTGDDFDWLLGSGGTTSFYTGPDKDHTLQTAFGHYVFIEASSPAKPNFVAWLESEVFRPTGSGGRCVKFWYHMKGNSIGSLNVLVKGQNGTKHKIWNLDGQQGTVWKYGQAPIRSTVDYQVVLEGVRGSSYAGDIALDDIEFTNFACVNLPSNSVPVAPTTKLPPTVPTTQAPTPAPSIWNCNFTFDKCTWSDDPSGHFNWTRQKGSTGSFLTGPSTDHTSGTAAGYYIFIETSYPRVANDTARLISKTVPPTFSKCLQFWYHMYGDHVDNLTVYLKSPKAMTPIFFKRGSQGNRWRHGTVDIIKTTQFQIIFEATRGNSYRGDIALDDISLTNGRCPPQAECTFEDPKLCGWSNIHGDNFDWTRASGFTVSQGTGPSADHTYGTKTGYYMYIETSSPRTKGHKAWLQSKDFTPTNGRCLQFWYHMYGFSVGTLNVLLYANGSRSSPVWSLSGNQGNMWRVTQVTIKSPVQHKIMFEGITGASYSGDIAIDDVQITPGECPLPGNCDFEKGMCTYLNVYYDNFDWLVGKGGTFSQFTGPKVDHSLGTKDGHYLFIETSYPRMPQEKAYVESEVISSQGTQGKCLNFWYHMFGTHIGTLKVYMFVQGQSWSVIWHLDGEQGNQWLQAQVPVMSRGKNVRVLFEGIRGEDYKGDIAIDDITFTDFQGKCPLQPSKAVPWGCNFEVDTCNWKQTRIDNFDWKRNRGSTGSIGTGPSVDHSTGTRSGYYMYIETSAPRKTNDTAMLISPVLKGNGTKMIRCMQFYYHMYGPHVNSLKIYQRQNYKNLPVLWERKGTQGPNWRYGEVQIMHTDDTQVVFEGTRGVSYRGDIAIDDIDIEYGDCPSSGMCTFEGAFICGWYQETRDDFDWTRASGSTPSVRTGPKADHTYGTKFGHYIYVETSNSLPVNSKARIRTPYFYNRNKKCVQFFYHMFGQTVNKLNVKISYGYLVYTAFTRTGNQNDTWHLAQVDVNLPFTFQVIFEGIKGQSYTGDIAIDDFRIKDGACPTPGDCDFEDGDHCTWFNNLKDDFDWLIGNGRTSSLFTGPSTDHTTGTASGYYTFIETSAPRKAGDKALLESIQFPATSSSGKCISFWYHMYGSSIGVLNVYMRNIGTKVTRSLLWQLRGNQGNKWAQGRIPLSSGGTAYQVVFEAIRGTSFSGDIALDDLVFTVGTCTFLPSNALPPGKTTPLPTPTPTPSRGPTAGTSGNDCNFEPGFCKWTQSSTTTFQWKRHKGSTASIGTGPKADHTKGDGSGYYVYIETSSPAKMNDTARLISGDVPVVGTAGLCLSFYYHMYGPHVNRLNVKSKVGTKESLLWARVGTQGDSWRRALVQLPKTSSTSKVILEALRGSSYLGDIAIDDISFLSGTCPPPSECTFEYAVGGQLTCQWTQDKANDKFDWTRANKNTPSVRTGPSTDHTLRTAQGYYMYIETSYPRKKGENAILVSPQYGPTKGKCFTFWYHMYGSSIGSLRILMEVNGKRSTLWSKSGDQGNIWRSGYKTVTSSSSSYKLAFEGIVGSSYQGDIAIDDIKLIDGSCPAPGDCDFEKLGMCTYLQDTKEDDFDWLRGSGSTSSWLTGPKIDFTEKTATGHYMFIEASYPQKKGDKARLVSEKFSPTGIRSRCVQFAFHMYGSTIGALNVYVKTGPGNSSESLIWTNAGNHGNQWISAQAPIVSSKPYTVVFEGVVGSSYTGDIAIDGIAFVNFRCAHIPANAAPPTVAPTTVTPADSNCTFETGLCRWKQLKNDKFDWTRNEDNTGSVGTGPLGDHTTGKGHYLYIETSYPRKENDTAVIESPLINPSVSVVCFTFWFHMHGAHVNQMNVYRVVGASKRRIWTRKGTQSNKWRYAQINIGGYRSFKVQIEGIRGKDYQGDIAIDDIVVQDNKCPHSDVCDFEDLSMCTWYNLRGGDKFDWVRKNGGTPSLGTGPSTDHTTGTSQGNFLFIETSFPRRRGDNAMLYSRYLTATTGRCLNFWYHMYGADIGNLNVYILQGSNRTMLWNRTGDHGNVWRHARVTYKSKTSFRVIFEGVVGKSYRGDIAVDDISFVDYPCPPPGSCNFEDGLCTWANVLNGNKTGYDDFDWEFGSGSTPSIATGPKVDHTLGNALGTYLFIETSGFRRIAGERAFLESELFPPSNGRCMSYWYHMYGTTIGTLRIWVKNSGGLQLLRAINGSQGNVWKEDEVGVYSRTNFKVIIEGVRGKDYRGDIAIDDIYFKDQNCVGLCSSVKPTARVRCGYTGVTAARCTVTLGCCYDDSVPNVPACFFHPSSCSAVPPNGRQQCGADGISRQTCENLGCCFDPNVPRNGINCYHSLAATTKFPPTRKPLTTPAPSEYDCTFESGFCKFTNSKADKFDWRRMSGGTSSVNTGPSADHTLGNKNGYYVYIETSFQKQNDTANLVSPLINFKTGGNNVCVRFWFHMYGAHVDTLNVYRQVGSTLPKSPVWTKDGTHGNAWRYAQIVLPRLPAFQVVFQGTRGPGYQGDISLDDIGFVNGDCPPTWWCDFEVSNNCGYTQDASDDFDWTRASANTTSYQTGPPADHTYGTKQGHYLHIEASYPRQPGDRARIESPEHPSTYGKCVEFYYHMYGADMGTLRVLLRKGGVLVTQPLWSISGDQGYQWQRMSVTVKSSLSWKIVFEGVRGSGYRSDIAIDDIKILDGECPSKGSCDFEDGLCSYDNTKVDNFDWVRHSGSTPSIQTGPKTDHTLGTSLGYYMYIESSAPRKSGEKARLLSELFKVNPEYKWCVTFWYHMYGSSVGSLRVGTRYQPPYGKGRYYYRYYWTQTGNHGDSWHYAQADIVSSYNFKILFEGSIGGTPQYTGDIAVDDISVKAGKCPKPTPSPSPNPCAVRCQSGQCIPANKVCDFVQDCGAGDISDEANCGACDFEKGLCSWNDTSTGTFDWRKQKGATGTPNTGPTVDHTLGNALGSYVYVEASSGSSFDLAKFQSPVLQQAAAACQLQFWYHMYGSSIGTLRVYVVTGTRHTLLWEANGNQGKRWKQAIVYIMRRRKPYRLLLEAERSYGSRGDIAVDDISLSKCALPAPSKNCWSFQFRCSKTRACISRMYKCDFQDDCGDNSDEENCYYDQYPYRCNFEYSLCSWRQLKDDQFDWTRSFGSTGSYGTGPKFDHTTGTGSGYYLYAEASYPRKKGDKARLKSGNFMPTQSTCYIRFYYHMWGDDIGVLNVYTRECEGKGCPEKLIWRRNGTVGNFWARAAVGVRSAKPFQFIIEAVRGPNYAGDMAIDDVTFYRCTAFYRPLPTPAPSTTPVPTTTPCKKDQFYCKGDGLCIAKDQYCDYVADCKDGSDEALCGPCDFEKGTCGHSDKSVGKLAWARGKYPVDQTGNGPTTDHTKGSAGYYMYVKTGAGTQSLPAKLVSGPLGQTGPNCVIQLYLFSNTSYFADLKVGFLERGIDSFVLNQGGKTNGKWAVVQSGVGARRRGWQLTIQADYKYMAIDDISFVNCSLPPNRGGQCGKLEASCANGRCVSNNVRCDYANDCGDRSDETYNECKVYKQRCNFQTSICDWYQNADDNFDWTRKQGATSSLDSGPGNDHTLGTRLGYYLYIETSYPRRPNDTAKLSSIVFRPVTAADKCYMRFFYHMYGQHINQLNVYTTISSAPSSPMKLVWSKTGPQGDMWRRAEIMIKSSDNFKVVIEGVRGVSYAGDIAIDDISFTPGCKPDYAATLSPDAITASPPPGCKAGQFRCKSGECKDAHLVCNFKKDCSDGSDEATCPSKCDFENDICGWSNPPTGDLLDWVRHQGQTPSNGTGPDKDHTKNSKYGWYVYMEAGQRPSGSFPNAHFVSPLYYQGARSCKFNFWYNMWHYKRGTDVKLSVLFRKNGKDTVLWQSLTSTGNKWRPVSITLPPCPTDFQMVFEGLHYWATLTDVAIDDVNFTCSEPAPPSSCGTGYFQCTKTKQCVPTATMCDFDRNCCDGSDEIDASCKSYKGNNFENGFGDWTQLNSDDFDWTLTSGVTQSGGTGPKRDHTLGEEHGKYIYIEASSPRKENQTARIVSPTIKGSGSRVKRATGGCTLRLFYHMYGFGIGKLNVYIATTYGQPATKVFTISGNQGSQWKRQAISLQSGADFQVIIEGTIGKSFSGDIALDDISFTPECEFNGALLPGAPTPPPVDPCLPNFQCRKELKCISRRHVCDFHDDCSDGSDEVPSLCGYPCGFEKNEGMCGWQNAANDDYDWQIHTGNTPSVGTGPTGDATGNKSRQYLYFEVSQRRIHKKAIINSPIYSGSFADCVFSFYYHMYGANVGEMSLQLQDINSSQVTTLWQLTGYQSRNWQNAVVSIGRRFNPFRLYLNGTVGNGYRGDLCVDQFNFYNCSPPEQCNDATGKFICSNGACVDENKLCDLTDDCGDGSDEGSTLCQGYIGCDFEADPDPCNFTDIKDDDFDWTRHRGRTFSVNTGPSRDHTYGTSLGWYKYMETSNRRYKQRAQLMSIKFKALEGGFCQMRIFYHMFGRHVKDFNIYVKRDSSSTLIQKFTATGNQGDIWKKAVIDLSKETKPFNVIIEGVRGYSYIGDIAIDDISFTPDCLTNGSRPVFPTVKPPCSSDQFQCISDKFCIMKSNLCDGTADCHDGSDEKNCKPSSGKATGNKLGAQSGVLAAIVVGVLVVLLVIILVAYIVYKRKREKKLHLFSVFYDPTKQQGADTSGDKGVAIKEQTGVTNPVYDERPMADYSMGELDAGMFREDTFDVPTESKGGATSMANPLYQDPYIEYDNSPLSEF